MLKPAFGCLFLIASVFLAIPINGYVIAVLWGWFIIPIFNVRAIGITEAVGLSIFVSSVSPMKPTPPTLAQKESGEDDYAAGIWRLAANVFLVPGLTLVLAWIWHTLFLPS